MRVGTFGPQCCECGRADEGRQSTVTFELTYALWMTLARDWSVRVTGPDEYGGHRTIKFLCPECGKVPTDGK